MDIHIYFLFLLVKFMYVPLFIACKFTIESILYIFVRLEWTQFSCTFMYVFSKYKPVRLMYMLLCTSYGVTHWTYHVRFLNVLYGCSFHVHLNTFIVPTFMYVFYKYKPVRLMYMPLCTSNGVTNWTYHVRFLNVLYGQSFYVHLCTSYVHLLCTSYGVTHGTNHVRFLNVLYGRSFQVHLNTSIVRTFMYVFSKYIYVRPME